MGEDADWAGVVAVERSEIAQHQCFHHRLCRLPITLTPFRQADSQLQQGSGSDGRTRGVATGRGNRRIVKVPVRHMVLGLMLQPPVSDLNGNIATFHFSAIERLSEGNHCPCLRTRPGAVAVDALVGIAAQ
ncbi:hypothetical protein D3C85_1070940 [compost metagenome]